MKKHLTNKQLAVYCFLKDYFSANDQLPSGDAVSQFIGATTHNAGFQHMKILEKKGWIERNAAGKYRFSRDTTTAPAPPEVEDIALQSRSPLESAWMGGANA